MSEDKGHSRSKYKLIIAVRTDLKMGVGKVAVQVGHACSIIAKNALVEESDRPIIGNPTRKYRYIWHEWFDEGQFKVVLKVDNEDHLGVLVGKARSMGLPVVEVRDYGFTQVAADTLTCIAIGPSLVEDVNKVTGGLSLL